MFTTIWFKDIFILYICQTKSYQSLGKNKDWSAISFMGIWKYAEPRWTYSDWEIDWVKVVAFPQMHKHGNKFVLQIHFLCKWCCTMETSCDIDWNTVIMVISVFQWHAYKYIVWNTVLQGVLGIVVISFRRWCSVYEDARPAGLLNLHRLMIITRVLCYFMVQNFKQYASVVSLLISRIFIDQ